MYKKICSYIIIIFFLSILGGCGASRKLAKKTQSKPTYNREAMRHVIDGAISELLGQPKNALVAYHQAAEIDTSSSGIYLSLAENYFVLGEIKSSIRLAQKSLKINPTNLDALELLAVSYEKQKAYHQAQQVYEKIVQLNPHDIEILYHLASLQIVNNEYLKGFQTYQKMVNNGLDDPDYRLRVGHLFLQTEEIDYAKSVYMDVYNDFKEIETPYLALAKTAMASGDTTDAINWYRKALMQDASFKDAKGEIRVLYEKRGMWDEAIELYTILVEKEPDDISNKLQLAQFYFQKGDTLKAEAEFQHVIEEHPENERGYLALAALYKIKNDTVNAINTYKKALAENAESLTARSRLKDLYAKQKKWDRAIALYETLKDVDSTFVGSRIEISNLYMQKGDTSRAIQQIERISGEHAEDWRIPVTLARYHFIAKNNDKAAKYFNKSLKIRKDLPGVWILRGLNYMQMDSLDQALDNFVESLEKFPDDAELNYYAGIILNQKRKFSRAVQYLEKSLDSKPNNIQALLSLASAYDELKLYDKSEKIYITLLEMDNQTPVILNNYAYHLAVRGIHLAKALELSKKAVQADPENAAYLDTIGWIYYKLGEYDNAEKFILQSLEIRDDAGEVYEHLGDIYHKMGQPEKARQAWEKALKLDQNQQRLTNKLLEVSK